MSWHVAHAQTFLSLLPPEALMMSRKTLWETANRKV